jgi:alpha-1,6-mannosyltransferase
VVSGPPADLALPLPRAHGRAVPRWAQLGARGVVQAAGIAALGTIVGVSVAIVLAAAERPSFLSGPAHHGFPGWMVGPLAHHLASLPNDTPALQDDLTRALVVLGVAWLVATVCASRLPAAVVWAGVVATQGAFLLAPPLSLTDLFNYLHYGRMAANYGLNPYVALPTAAPADPAYPFSNWHHLPSPYGPLFTTLTEGLAPLHLATAYWVWKGIAAAAALGTLAIVAVTARRLGRSPQAAVALVGLNPLVLVYGVGGAHNEPLLLLCALGAVALAVRGRLAGVRRWDVAAGACTVLAAGFKPSAALLVPVVILGCRRRGAALAGAAGAAALVLAIVAVLYGGHLPATGIQERLVTPFSVPNVLAALAGHGGMNAHDRTLAHVVLALATVAAAGVVAWRRAWLPGAVGFVMLAAVLTLGWTMPWYVWWVLPFAALARTRVLAVTCVLLTVWLAFGAIPQSTSLLHTAGYYPTRTQVGRANHLYGERYLR